jgi:hypothetical protein
MKAKAVFEFDIGVVLVEGIQYSGAISVYGFDLPYNMWEADATFYSQGTYETIDVVRAKTLEELAEKAVTRLRNKLEGFN